MGWLKEHGKKEGFKSLRAVALAMAESDDWHGTIQARSLGNKLRDLDKHKDVSWWLENKGQSYLPILADVLSFTVDELRAEIQKSSQYVDVHPSDSYPFVFDAFPELRSLDLKREKPFPGIPSALLQDRGPRGPRCWWQAPPGAGKTLVGQWLEARWGWTYFKVETWQDALQRLPQRGRVYIELSAPPTDEELKTKLPGSLQICIAASFGSTRDQRDWEESKSYDDMSGPYDDLGVSYAYSGAWLDHMQATYTEPNPDLISWTYIDSETSSQWSMDLVDWVEDRLMPGGGLKCDLIRKAIRANRLPRFSTPGEMIGFLSVLEQSGTPVNMDDAREQNGERWIRIWLNSALNRRGFALGSAQRAKIESKGADILIEMISSCIELELDPTVARDDWDRCLESPKTQDREHALRILKESGVDLELQHLAKAAFSEKVEDPKIVLQGLRTLGIFTPHGVGLKLQPAWLVQILLVESQNKLFTSSRGLGALLAHQKYGRSALGRLCERVLVGECADIERALDNFCPNDPERMLALSGCFYAAGFALIQGTKLPPKLIEELWHTQMRHRVSRHKSLPRVPWMLISWSNRYEDNIHMSVGIWYLAAFSISLYLNDMDVRLEDSDLNPWKVGFEQSTTFLSTLDKVAHLPKEAQTVAAEQKTTYLRELSYLFGDLLYERLGLIFTQRHEIISMQTPRVLIALYRGDECELNEKDERFWELLKLKGGLDPIQTACDRHNIDFDTFLAWCWTFWARVEQQGQRLYPPWAGNILLSPRMLPGVPHSQSFEESHKPMLISMPSLDRPTSFVSKIWRTMPPQVASEPLPDEAYSRISSEAWEVWFGAWRIQGAQRREMYCLHAWHYAPWEWVVCALEQGLIEGYYHRIFDILWKREDLHKNLCIQIKKMARNPEQEANLIPLVFSTPDTIICDILDIFDKLLSQANVSPPQQWFSSWLVDTIFKRGAGWRKAYVLMFKYNGLC